MTPYLIVFGASLICVAAVVWLRERNWSARARVLRGILDDADALELELQRCRTHLRELPALVSNLPVDLSARATLTAEPQVQAALHDLLQHRLWLRQHGADASLQELRGAATALSQSRGRLAAQMQRLAQVRSELDQARIGAGPSG